MFLKKTKDSLAAFAYLAILYLVKVIPTRTGKNKLLIIKTDEIGDYVLFHSYLKYFKQSEKYKNHRVTLIGNSAWRQIFEEYDSSTSGIDELIWLDKRQFKKDLFYRFAISKKIRQIGFSDVINCIFSRSLLLDDGIAYIATGKNKIAMKGDNTNRGANKKDWDDIIYTAVTDAGSNSFFDATRNRNFVSTILQIQNIPVETKIEVKSTFDKLPFEYYIMFLGSGNPERKWPLEYFLQTADYIHSKYGLVLVICGGPDDTPDAENFEKRYHKETVNYAGKTSLLQLIELLGNAKFLLCVDTGALHIAAAVKCPVIGLYSGKFYGRFAPYPKEITGTFCPVYPDFVDKLIAKKDQVLYDTFKMKNDTIKMIPVAKIIPYVDEIIKQNKLNKKRI